MKRSGRVIRPRPLSASQRSKSQLSQEMYVGEQHISDLDSNEMKNGGTPIPRDLTSFEARLHNQWFDCFDFHTRELQWVNGEGYVFFAWLTFMTDRKEIMEGIITPLTKLMDDNSQAVPPNLNRIEQSIAVPLERKLRTMEEVYKTIAEGQMVMFVDGVPEACAIDVSVVTGRPIDISEGEPAIMGPQAAFVEQLSVNLGQVRRIIHDPRLKMRMYEVGELSHTKVVLLYIDGVTKPAYLDEWERRAHNLKVATVEDSNKIRELITDGAWSPFPTVESTERPDKVAAALSEGKIAIAVDGSPDFLLVPTIFVGLLTAGEDYYGNFFLSFPIRILRHLMFWTALMLPSLYIALLTYNQDLIPTPLLINLEAQHEGIPFPTIIEAAIMQLSFEALREAGVRLPRAVGQSVSIVGALIIGEAAVTAGIVSPGMVIVVAATGVASFTIPDYTLVNAVRVLQIGFFLSAGVLGLYGITILGILLVLHMASLRSFGVPYLAPWAPFEPSSDALWRSPYWLMKSRPKIFEPVDQTRARTKKPSP